MRSPFRSNMLPIFPIAAGILGYLLRIWLFAVTDAKGLLPSKHFAGVALFWLTALALLGILLSSIVLEPRKINKQLLRWGDSLACLWGAVGFVLTATLVLAGSNARLSPIAKITSLAGGLAFLVMALLRLTRKRIHYILPSIVTMALILYTITYAQVCGAMPQLQEYFFPLMACIFLLLTAYYKTALLAKYPQPNLLAFFSQGAVFFCLVSLKSPQWLLFLGMLPWAILQIYPCTLVKKKV